MKRQNKYNAKKTVVDGITFDSKKEAARYAELKLLEKSGCITNLKLQEKFEIVPKRFQNKTARYYIADFVYTEGYKDIIEDVKSPATRHNPVYSLKKALMLVNYPGFEFREV